MPFSQLSLDDLKLGLRSLLGPRHKALVSTLAGQLYEARLRAQLTTIEALPDAVSANKPYAAELSATDDAHDAYGGAIYDLIGAYLAAPSTSESLRAVLRELRAGIVPERTILKSSYADESSAAHDRVAFLAKHRKALAGVPLAEGRTLYDWAVAFTDAGLELGRLLERRANVSKESRAGVVTLPATTRGMLNRFRVALADELADEPERLAATDRAVFAYLDLLEANRKAGVAAAPAEDDTQPAQPSQPATP